MQYYTYLLHAAQQQRHKEQQQEHHKMMVAAMAMVRTIHCLVPLPWQWYQQVIYMTEIAVISFRM